jgi:hypothetical protein
MFDLGVGAENALSDIVGSDLERTAAETAVGYLQRGASMSMKISGMQALTNLERTLAVNVAEAAIARAGPRKLSQIGADETITKLISTHAANGRLNLDQWPAAEAEWMRLTLAKEARASIASPGIADLPIMATSTELGRVISQFTGFTYAFWNRVVRPTARNAPQMPAATVAGIASYMGLTWLAQYARAHATSAERGADWDKQTPTEQFTQVVLKSGIVGPIADLLTRADQAMTGQISRSLGLPQAFLQSYGSTSPTTLLGPGPTIVADAATAALKAATPGEQLTASDIRKIRRAVPLQNLWYLRRFVADPLEKAAGGEPNRQRNSRRDKPAGGKLTFAP